MKSIFIVILLSITSFAQDYNVMTEEWAPYQYTQNGQVKGICVDQVKELLSRLDIEAEINVLPWARAYYKTQNKDNQVLFNVSRTKQREKLFKWVGPLMKEKDYFFYFKNKNISINSLNDAKKYRVIAINKDKNHQFFIDNKFQNIVIARDNDNVIQKLINNRADLISASKISMLSVIKKYPELKGKLAYSSYIVRTNNNYLALSKNTPEEEIDRWQNTWNGIVNEGLDLKIYNHYVSDF